MKLDLLDTPLRVTWDLGGPDPMLGDEQILLICQRLGRAGIFYLTLEGQGLSLAVIGEVLQQLCGDGLQISIVYGSTKKERSALKAGLPLQRLWLDVASHVESGALDGAGISEQVEFLRSRGYEPSLLMVPQRKNLHLLPSLLDLCRELKVGTFKLPNVPVNGSFSSTLASRVPRPDDWARLSRLLGENTVVHNEVKLEIHDRFLWELLAGGDESELSEYGGCQAGNSLAHVDARGLVLPCSSWPEPIGDLLRDELETIWASESRLQVRREIDGQPAGCCGCGEYHLCLGACRGLGRTLNEQAGGRDPGCGAPR